MISVYLIALAVLAAVLLYNKLSKILKTFDEIGLRNVRPKFLLSFLFQRKSFPDILQEWYKAFPNEK